MPVQVFLSHRDPAGSETHILLHQQDPTGSSTHFLPDRPGHGLSVSPQRDPEHGGVRLDVQQQFCLLSVYEDQLEPVIILGKCEVEMPVSTATHQKSIILTEGDQFLTALGKWCVVWDRSGEISQSMRAPPMPSADPGTIDFDLSSEQGLQFGGEDLFIEEHTINIPPSNNNLAPSTVVDIHLPIAAIDTSDGDDSSSEVDAELVNPALATVSNVAHSEQPKSSTDDPDTESERNSITKAARHEVDVPQLNDHTVAAEQPKPARQQESVLEQRLEETLDMKDDEQRDHDKHNMLRNNNDDEDSTTQTTAEVLTVVRLRDHVPGTFEQPEHSPSDEDEPERVGTTRTKKRRYSDVERDTGRGHCKRSKIEELPQRSTIAADDPEVTGQEDTITVATNLPKTPSTSNKISAKKSSGRAHMQRGSTSKRTAKAKLQSESPATSSLTSPVSIRRSSRRKDTPSSSLDPLESVYSNPKIVFSSTSTLAGDKEMCSTIAKLGGVIVTEIDEADVLCVGDTGLKKTSKFVIAVAKGKEIVTDGWLRQAHIDQKFPDCRAFQPIDNKHETEWDFSLPEALKRGKQGLRLLEGTHIYLTAQLRKDLGNLVKDLKLVGMALGASTIRNGLPAKSAKSKVLVVGSIKNDDPECCEVNRRGHQLYSQDILTMAALRGRLEVTSAEFIINPPIKEEQSSQ